MQAYINGTGCISPQETFDTNSFLENITEYNENFLQVVPPVYKEFIKPIELRRMSRIIRMGLTSALICLKDSEIESPDSIITGTGMGCVEDTEKFLTAVLENKEQLLTPTSFIRSTHNTVGAQIAVTIRCHNYNYTYVHRGFSFESALLDAMMLIDEKEAANVLVGAIDETSENNFIILGRLNYWKKDLINNLDLLKHNTSGSISGEASVFFTISEKPSPTTYAKINGIKMFSDPVSKEMLESQIQSLMQDAGLSYKDIDLLVMGYSGDSETDSLYKQAASIVGENIPQVYFKHLCGEFHTSSAFGLWTAANILKRNHIPEVLKVGNFNLDSPKNILLYNHHRNEQHSLILLSK